MYEVLVTGACGGGGRGKRGDSSSTGKAFLRNEKNHKVSAQSQKTVRKPFSKKEKELKNEKKSRGKEGKFMNFCPAC